MRNSTSEMLSILVLIAAIAGVRLLSGVSLSDLGIPGLLADTQEPEPAARFEPSSQEIIKEMLKMAAVTEKDVVYDLGSGDGRIVIAAARAAGARGVGVDIDAKLINKSRINAEKANVGHLVRFLQEDLFKTDIGEATVVMLYLNPEANLKLRPRLLRELKPGARIVSHSHDMDDWKPDGESRAGDHSVFSWIVPADISGRWKLDVADKYAQSDYSLEFEQRFQEIESELKAGREDVRVAGARLMGKTVEFTVEQDLGSVAAPAVFTGKVDGDTITGTFKTNEHSGTWTAKRMR